MTVIKTLKPAGVAPRVCAHCENGGFGLIHDTERWYWQCKHCDTCADTASQDEDDSLGEAEQINDEDLV